MRTDLGSSERVNGIVREFLSLWRKIAPSAWQEELREQRLEGELGESLEGHCQLHELVPL